MFKWWKNFIDRLAKSNQKNFGSEKLDCCNMNKQTSNKNKG